MKVQKRHYFLSALFIGLLIWVVYQVATFFSLYPNDWFLKSKEYKNNPCFFYQNDRRFRYITQLDTQDIFAPYLSNFESLLKKNQTLVLRDHPARTVFLVNLQGSSYLVKRYNVTSFFNWLQKAPIRSSKAFRSWHYGNKLLKMGVTTPKPLALYEQKVGPFWKTTYIITEYIQGSRDLTSNIKEKSKIESAQIVEEIESHLRCLKKNHLIHADYGFRNLLVLNTKIYIIDLDDLHHYHLHNIFFQKRFQKKHYDQLKKDGREYKTTIWEDYINEAK